jgi:hypothetical protein
VVVDMAIAEAVAEEEAVAAGDLLDVVVALLADNERFSRVMEDASLSPVLCHSGEGGTGFLNPV